MDMNKTMINFNKNNGLAADRAQHILVSGDNTSGIMPKLKAQGAFRHTEYAKGFYKVND